MSEFVYRYQGRITRWLNQNNVSIDEREDFIQLFNFHPIVFKKLLKDELASNEEKIKKLINYIIQNPDIILGVCANQRMGKDSFLCWLLQEIKKILKDKCRIVTLGTFLKYPFEDEEEPKYFSLEQIPIDRERTVFVYVSEADLFFNNYDWNTPEGKLLNKKLNVLAQNGIKIISAVKMFKNIMKPMREAINIKCFKYVTKDKYEYEDGKALSEEYRIMIPKKPLNDSEKDKVLVKIDDDYFTIRYTHPTWYNNEFSNQYANITEENKRNHTESLINQGFTEEQAIKETNRVFNF